MILSPQRSHSSNGFVRSVSFPDFYSGAMHHHKDEHPLAHVRIEASVWLDFLPIRQIPSARPPIEYAPMPLTGQAVIAGIQPAPMPRF